MSDTAILIPARYNSTRFPGKPLVDLGGISMIGRVMTQCNRSGLDTYVLTDDKRVADEASKYGNVFCHSGSVAENGTARCAESVKHEIFNKYDSFINVQGDMPDVDVSMIQKVQTLLTIYNVATLYTDLDPADKADPNTVKMVTNGMTAQWFGRGFTYGHRHLGIYGYRHQNLVQYNEMESTEAEVVEGLEQLRWYRKDVAIGVHKVDFNGVEINTPDDLKGWKQ